MDPSRTIPIIPVLLDALALLFVIAGPIALVVAAWATDWRLGLAALGTSLTVAGLAVATRKDS